MDPATENNVFGLLTECAPKNSRNLELISRLLLVGNPKSFKELLTKDTLFIGDSMTVLYLGSKLDEPGYHYQHKRKVAEMIEPLSTSLFLSPVKNLVFLGGTNDLDLPLGKITSSIEKSILLAKSLRPELQIFIGTIPPVGDAWPNRVTRQTELNNWVRKLPEKYSGITVVDFDRLLGNGQGGFAPKYVDLLKDKVHPNAVGNQVMRDNILKALGY